MPGIDKIIGKIINDAKMRAKDIEDQANQKRQEILDEKTQEANNIKDNILIKAKEESDSILEKATSTANLKARDTILLAEEEVIEKVLAMVKEELNNLTEEDFIKYLKTSIKDLKLTSEDKVRVPEKYYKAVKNSNLNLKVSDEFTDSGFIVKKNNLIYNGDFSNIVDSMKEDLMPLIADELFNK